MSTSADRGRASAPGRLVVVATPIGNLGDLAPRAREELAAASAICCEDTRRTGMLLKHAGIAPRELVALHAHNEAGAISGVLELLASGASVALVTDAGTPLVSDPGERLVAAAIAAGVTITMVPGPVAAVAALVASGLDSRRWRFEGFLPRKGAERTARLRAVSGADETTLLYEAPHRLAETLHDLANVCGVERRVVVARELTKLYEEVWRGTLEEALELVASRPARGEYVLVLEAAPPAPPAGESAVRQAIGVLLSAGLSRRDAAVAVERLLGVSHRVAYEAALERPHQEGD